MFDNCTEFVRDFYNDLLNKLQQYSFIALLGPRRCGKTTVLMQMNKRLNNTQLVNFKKLTKREQYSVIDLIKEAIRNNEDTVFLLDEITYLDHADAFIADVSDCYTEFNNNFNTKIVVTGSQCVAIKTWVSRAFASSAAYLDVSFLSYKEWLRYKQTTEISDTSFRDFVMHSSDFYKFYSITDYLQGCLDETVISNEKTMNVIFDNDCSNLNTEVLLSVLYNVMFTLHNHVNIQTFMKPDKLYEELVYYLRNTSFSDEAVLRQAIASSYVESYRFMKTMDLTVLKQAIVFLYKCGLITVTVFSDSFSDKEDVIQELTSEDCKYCSKESLLNRISINVKYPMFFIALVKGVVGDGFEIPEELLGAVVECYCRGLLNSKCSYQYRNNDTEIDYVDYVKQEAIEFTVKNKPINKIKLLQAPEEYRKILLTKSIDDTVSSVRRIPYYKFIYDLC